MPKQNPLEKAEIILAQLGGSNALVAMLGAHSFVGGEEGTLTFQIRAKARSKINRVHVVLNPRDLYDVTFYKGRGVNIEAVTALYDVPSSGLRRAVEEVLGLDLRVPSIRGI